MRPNIKQMKNRIAYLGHQLDLEIAHWRHAEEEIEKLKNEIIDKDSEIKIYRRSMLLGDREMYEAMVADLKEQKEALNKEMDRLLLSNYELQQTNNNYIQEIINLKYSLGKQKNLSVALQQINNQKNTIDVQTQTLNEQAERIGSLEAENKILKEKLASKEKLLVCKLNPVPICECGKLAGYNVLGTYYCPECVTKVIKL